jgi:hypothetical protein
VDGGAIPLANLGNVILDVLLLAIWVLPLLAIWVLPSYLIARYAERKGHSFVGFLLLGLIISWVISGIVALVVEDKREPRPVVVASLPGDHLDRLKQLTELRDAGALSPEAFEAEKAWILESRG